METFFPWIWENIIQVRLIEKKAREMWVAPKDIGKDWVENFSPLFRDVWDSGERDIDMLEEKIYAPEVWSNYADMVQAIIVK